MATIVLLFATGWLLVIAFTLWRLSQINKASITCPVCGLTSYHPIDRLMGYCRDCDDYTTP